MPLVCYDCGKEKEEDEFPKARREKFKALGPETLLCLQCSLNTGKGKKGEEREKRYWNPSIKVKRCTGKHGCGRLKRTSSFHMDRGRPKAMCKECTKRYFKNYYYNQGGKAKQYDTKFNKPLARLKKLMDIASLIEINEQREKLNLPALTELPSRRAKDRVRIEGIDY